jgi:hypothetical protein
MKMLKTAASSLFFWHAVFVIGACKPTSTRESYNYDSVSNGNYTASVQSCKLQAPSDADSSAGFITSNNCVSSTGNVRGFMIFVDFSDAEAPADDPPENLRDFFLPDTIEWYTTASNGALSLNVTADVSRYYRMPASAASYNFENNRTYASHISYIQDALQAYGQ